MLSTQLHEIGNLFTRKVIYAQIEMINGKIISNNLIWNFIFTLYYTNIQKYYFTECI